MDLFNFFGDAPAAPAPKPIQKPPAPVAILPPDPLTLLPARIPAWDALLRRCGVLRIRLYATALWTGVCLEVVEDERHGHHMLMSDGRILPSAGNAHPQCRRIFMRPDDALKIARRTGLALIGAPGTHFCGLVFDGTAHTDQRVIEILTAIDQAGPAPKGAM